MEKCVETEGPEMAAPVMLRRFITCSDTPQTYGDELHHYGERFEHIEYRN